MRFDIPIGSATERNGLPWGSWFDSNPYGTYYQLRPGVYAYHTGADLNKSSYADVNAPVYASADGEVVHSGVASGFEDLTVNLKHVGAGENGQDMWTRYAHMATLQVVKGQKVLRGHYLGNISDYSNNGPPNDHLHFDVARVDLGARPADWPATDLARLHRDYTDPYLWIQSHREDDMAGAFVRADYASAGRSVHIAFMGDARWPNAKPATAAQTKRLWDEWIDPANPNSRKHSFTSSSDESAQRLVAEVSGAEGNRDIYLWGYPVESRATFLNFYNLDVYKAGQEIIWKDWPTNPQPPPSRARVTAADGVKSRTASSTSALSLGTLLVGSIVPVARADGDWYAYHWTAGGAPVYKINSNDRAELFSMSQFFEAVP